MCCFKLISPSSFHEGLKKDRKFAAEHLIYWFLIAKYEHFVSELSSITVESVLYFLSLQGKMSNSKKKTEGQTRIPIKKLNELLKCTLYMFCSR